MWSQLGLVNQLAPDHRHRDFLKIVRFLLLVQTRPDCPIQLRFVNVSVFVANGRDVHILVIHEHLVLDKWNHMRSQFDKREFHRIVEKLVGPFAEKASFEARNAVFHELPHSEDLEEKSEY